MSRFQEGDCDDVYGLLAAGRFARNERAVFKSPRGQKLLSQLEDALLRIPDRRLIADSLCEMRTELVDYGFGPEEVPVPEVCALGAFGVALGIPADEMASWDDYQEDAFQIAKQGGMTETMAWIIGYTNDATPVLVNRRYREETPEERWRRIFNKVQSAKETGVWLY